ncbi:MAG: formylglycine-generating enzyme family protein, partial [Planctomycetota bacterium]
SVEADEVIAEMCNFLEQLGNDSAPNLQEIKANLTAVAAELSNLKTINIAGLSEIKDFNQRREELLGRIAGVEQDLSELSAENLERLCKQSVARTVQEIKGRTADPGQTQAVSELSSILWAFLPEHSDWEQWTSFLELYHVALSGEEVHLTAFASLRPAGKDGSYLSLTQVAGDFVDTFCISTGDSDNFGWPRYVGHQKDPSVILVFVPGTGATGIKPFYMARREISNAQYRRFMEQTGAKSQAKLTGWSYFTDKSGNPLICQAQGQYPPSRITFDGSAGTFLMDDEFKDAPVTWVMCDGARAYAGWLGGQLPTVSQNKHAALAGAGTTYPWGNDLSDATTYAHVRSAAWQSAAREYNAKRDNPVEIAYPPVGAVKDYLRGETLAPTKVVHSADDRYPVWPCLTDNAKPNDWGLYDMVGNVWEWCTDPENDSAPVICGGSCLSPPEYARPDAKHVFKAQACDVGFRVVIPVE